MPRLRFALAALLVAPLLACAAEADDADLEVSDRDAETSGYDASGDVVSAGDADEGVDGVEAYRIGSADHVSGVIDYPVNPSPGGPHNQRWADCGFHEDEVDAENLVHNLEHGVIWLAYSPDLPDSDIEVLRDLAERHRVVAAPFGDLEDGEAVVASAWARQLRLESVDGAHLEQFIEEYADASTAPEAGVPCTKTSMS